LITFLLVSNRDVYKPTVATSYRRPIAVHVAPTLNTVKDREQSRLCNRQKLPLVMVH